MTIEITAELIFAVVTAVVTAIVGWAAKKWQWPTKEYIPFQKLAIGILSGILFLVTGLQTNMVSALLIGLGASFGVAGMYDLMKCKNKNTKEK